MQTIRLNIRWMMRPLLNMGENPVGQVTDWIYNRTLNQDPEEKKIPGILDMFIQQKKFEPYLLND